jgi:hypothetical protein
MSHFAQIDDNNIVTQVIVAEQDVIDTGLFGPVEKWIQTSYNTHGGVHTLGGTPLRKNYAGIGYTYDPQLDAFVPPKPYTSWTLNETTGLWESPVPMPVETGKLFEWNEETQAWEAKLSEANSQ